MPLLESLARKALHGAGGLRLVRSLNRHALRILMYHSFGPARPGLRSVLEQRCEHLTKKYHPVSLGEVADAWGAGEDLPPNALAITVDDGYRDFYEIAYPILSACRLPATVYLVTDFMDGRSWLWPDQVRFLVENTAARLTTVDVPGAGNLSLELDVPDGRERAIAAINGAAKRMSDTARRGFLAGLPQALGCELPVEPPERFAPLTWDSVREMAANGIEFGAHTRTHPILSRVSSDTQLRDEVEGSKRRIETELSRPVRHFCYPNGKAADIGPRASEVVRQAGFETAVTTEEGFNYRGADPFALRRIPADPGYPEHYFQEYVAGVHAR